MNVEHPNYGQSYQLTRAALRLRTFTVTELEDVTGAVKNTVYSFISRVRKVDPSFIDDVDVPTLRGRPQKCFTLSESGRKYLAELSFEAAAQIGEAEEPYRFAKPVEVVETVELPSDIYEQERELVFQVDVPGMTEEDLEVKIEDQGLVVSGVRPAMMNFGAPQLVERRHGHFQRSYPLPEAFHARIINVDVQKGVLEVVLRNEVEGSTNLATAEGKIGTILDKVNPHGASLGIARFTTAKAQSEEASASIEKEKPHRLHHFEATAE
jgi:HSP20 family protein